MSLPKAEPNFNTVNAQNDALVSTTGLTIHELVAEAIEHERQKMLDGGDAKQYVKLLTTVFGKFSVGAPQHVITEEIHKPMTREEIKAKIDQYLKRISPDRAESSDHAEPSETGQADK